MADEGGRKNKDGKVISMAPDVCLTPAGPAQIPVPYPVVGSFGDSSSTSSNVTFGGDPAFVLGKSEITKVVGDEPGTSKGIASGTTGGKAKPIQGSGTVKINGEPVIRNGDLFKMNNGNTIGSAVIQSGAAPSASIGPDCEPEGDTNPDPDPETDDEKGWMDKLGGWFKNALSEAGEALKNPYEGIKGGLKDTINILPETAELLMKGAAAKASADMVQAAGVQSMLGNEEQAAQMMEMAEAQKELDPELPKFAMANSAQEGGAKIAMGAQLLAGGIGLARGGWKLLTKGLRKLAGKSADEAAELAAAATKAEKAAVKEAVEETAEEAAESAAKGAGDGVKVTATSFKGMVVDGIKVERVREGTHKIAIIGGPMGRVRKFAHGLKKRLKGKNYEVEIYDGGQLSESAVKRWKEIKEKKIKLNGSALKTDVVFEDNLMWAKKVKKEGYTVLDLGDARKLNQSEFYRMERNTLFGDQ